MTDKKPDTVKIEARRDTDGGVTIGAIIDKTFVPVASTPGNLVRHHLDDVEAGETTESPDEAEGGDE